MGRILVVDSACLNEPMFICCSVFHFAFNICNLHSCFFKILFINLIGSMLVHFLFDAHWHLGKLVMGFASPTIVGTHASIRRAIAFCQGQGLAFNLLDWSVQLLRQTTFRRCLPLLFRLLPVRVGLKIRRGIRLGRPSFPGDLGTRSTKESDLA